MPDGYFLIPIDAKPGAIEPKYMPLHRQGRAKYKIAKELDVGANPRAADYEAQRRFLRDYFLVKAIGWAQEDIDRLVSKEDVLDLRSSTQDATALTLIARPRPHSRRQRVSVAAGRGERDLVYWLREENKTLNELFS
jgi:hypothetical protein